MTVFLWILQIVLALVTLAAGTHLRHRELPNIALTIVLLLLAAIVAWARFRSVALSDLA